MLKKKNRILLAISIAFFLIGFLPVVIDFSNIMNKDPMYITISFFALGSVLLSFWGLEAHEDERAKKQKGIKNGSSYRTLPMTDSIYTRLTAQKGYRTSVNPLWVITIYPVIMSVLGQMERL